MCLEPLVWGLTLYKPTGGSCVSPVGWERGPQSEARVKTPSHTSARQRLKGHSCTLESPAELEGREYMGYASPQPGWFACRRLAQRQP